MRSESPRTSASETGGRVNAVAEWRSALTAVTGAALLYLSISGLVIYLAPFSEFSQFNVIVHTVIGLVSLLPIAWYLVRHWRVRRKGNLSHYKLIGYAALALLAACVVSGLVVTWQGIAGTRMSYAWDLVHLFTGIGMAVFIIVHLLTVIVRKVNNPDARRALVGARRVFYGRSVVGGGALLVVCAAWAVYHVEPPTYRAFDDDYNWRFGEDRPFAPSLARVDHAGRNDRVSEHVLAVLDDGDREAFLASYETIEDPSTGVFARIRQCAAALDLDAGELARIEEILAAAAEETRLHGAIDARALAGSAGCATSGCHSDIYDEWLPSAHRYSSMDDMFQRVQELMSTETSPEHTRYCAGCHDPISLFSGAKNSGNITLSVAGADEGASCIVCHSIVQTDVQGNADYTIRPPRRYVYETDDVPLARLVSDFLIRTYPRHHVESYSRPLYKTAEFCGACHKQYIDTEVNTDIGKVQGQNQYDSWKNSRWYHEGEPDKTINCRECHMPLVASEDPARGDATDYNRTTDDRRHRSHSMVASNQYVPLLHDLPGAEAHVALVEKWLRGEIEIPEIADKWTTGPVVRMEIDSPPRVAPGDDVALRVILVNNKTGHDFPTGPLDMIESWVELTVTDAAGNVIHHVGGLDEDGSVEEAPLVFKADGFDRRGELIDRHNLWDLVGASYKRAMYPGVTDAVHVEFQCPSMARGRVAQGDERLPPGRRDEHFAFEAPGSRDTDLTVTAVLWYRKANPEFLDRVYGAEAGIRSPVTEMSRATATIEVTSDDQASAQ